MDKNSVNIPKSRFIGQERKSLTQLLPMMLFPLQTNIMKPYPFRNYTTEQHIYKYRLSYARSIVENAFGILDDQFCVFLAPILFLSVNSENITLASCSLHNYTRTKSPNHYTPSVFFNRIGMMVLS